MTGAPILIVSTDSDEHAAKVVACLRDRFGLQTMILDLSAYPCEAMLRVSWEPDGAAIAALSGPSYEVPLGDFRVAWWRRPQLLRIHEDVQDATARRFALTEAHHALSGVWSLLKVAWVNPRARDDEASFKPYQLDVARSVGLTIPRTLITNDPEEAHRFALDVGPSRTVYKAFTGTVDAWRETRVLRDGELALLANVRYAPLIFQEYVPAAVDLRVTVIGPAIFASAIHSRGAPYPVDYRADLNAVEVEEFELPDEVQARIRALVDRLGLVYGAIDLRLTPSGEFVFLEINPSGQWLFMEERTGQPMTAAFAGLLAGLADS